MKRTIATYFNRFFTSIFVLLGGCTLCFSQSALKSGEWKRISVEESGVYKITYEDLISWGFSSAENVAIFGSSAGELSTMNTSALPDTIHEISISIHKGSDNVFNADDYILFYAESPNSWTYNTDNQHFTHNKHNFEDKNYYFVTTSRVATKFITNASVPTNSANKTVTTYDNLQFYEKNNNRVQNTGRELYELCNSNKTVKFSISNVVNNANAKVFVSLATQNRNSGNFDVSINGSAVGSLSEQVCHRAGLFNFTQKESSISVNIAPDESRFYLDFVELNARSQLKINNKEQLLFRDIQSVANSAVSKFTIQSSEQNFVWDVTYASEPKNIPTSFIQNQTIFTANSSELREYIAFGNSYKTPKFEGDVENFDILSATNCDMIIITTEMYRAYAQQIADLHTEIDKFNCRVVLQEEICAEFASYKRDVSASRNYLRYIYQKGNKKLKYVLFFGDGTFANENVELNDNKLFTFQNRSSIDTENSFCSDDFYGLLDDNCGVNSDDRFVGELSIAVGRFPVSNKIEAENITNKTIQYATNPQYRGDWQNYLCFLADDADDNQTMHMSDADQLCKAIDQKYPQFNIDKIFADAYRQVNSSAGQRYPDAVQAVHNRIQKGCLIFNYSGHGNETRMTAEYIVEASSIKSWKNKTKLPFFIGAACNIAHFDMDSPSLGELILTEKNGGGIGIISATRLSYASANYQLCDNIYDFIFEPDSLQQNRTIGESFKLAKAKTANDFYQNKRLYTLLGDPALRLAIPLYSIEIDLINGKNANDFSDQVKALSTLTVSGHIENRGKQIDENFNGTLYIKIFDKLQSVTTLGNDQNDTYTFNSYTNVLFQGLASVQNGRFNFTANIPQDIYYYNGKGKLSLYAVSDKADAMGAYKNLEINGSESLQNDDFAGPEILMYFNTPNTQQAITTHQNPILFAFIKDSSGINISNASIGHSVFLTIDHDESNQISLNDFYYCDLNTYTSGSLKYKLQDLSEGEHSITLTVYDSYNNKTEETLEFTVINSNNLTITKLWNYPNPMSDITHFNFEHNQAESEIKVIITIFDMQGNMVKKIEGEGTPNGFSNNELTWNGTSDGGRRMSAGIYPYTIEIQSNTGARTYGKQKILLVK